MFLLFDIGGTTTRMAMSLTGEKLDNTKIFPTNHNFDQAMVEMDKIAVELSGGEKYDAVVGGIRAYDRKRGMLFNQPNFPMWIDAPVLSKMKEMWGDVFLENDAALVGLGEAVFGAGKGHNIVAFMTMSTGVGGSRITRGKIDETSYAFEPGNMVIQTSGGGIGLLETLISGGALEKKYGISPLEINDDSVWEEVTDLLIAGLNNVVVMWSPDVIVLGGNVPKKLNFEKINEKLKTYCRIFPEVPPVKQATIDEIGGLYGGLAYLSTLP